MKKIILFLFVILLTACNSADEAVIRPVEYVVANFGNGDINKSFFGYLKSSSLVDLSFQIEGTLKDVFVKEGQILKKGQIIAALDAPLYQIQVREAKNNVNDYVIQYENAKNYYERIKKLHAAGGISDNDMDNAKTKMESARIQIETAKEKLQYTTQKSGYDKLFAPSNGIILNKIASEGQYVTPGKTIVKFQDTNNVEAYIFVPQNVINNLYVGQGTLVTIDALENKKFKGKVKEISQSSLEGAGFRVKITILEQSSELKDGMSANAEFEIKKNKKQITIPANSILKIDNTVVVYTISNLDPQKRTGEIKKTAVILGNIVNNNVEIISGLKSGDLVVTKGVNEVVEGQKVRY